MFPRNKKVAQLKWISPIIFFDNYNYITKTSLSHLEKKISKLEVKFSFPFTPGSGSAFFSQIGSRSGKKLPDPKNWYCVICNMPGIGFRVEKIVYRFFFQTTVGLLIFMPHMVQVETIDWVLRPNIHSIWKMSILRNSFHRNWIRTINIPTDCRFN